MTVKHIPKSKLTTDVSTDALVVEGLRSFKKYNSSYNGLSCNCSDYAKEGVLYASPSPVNNFREKIGSKNATTPNQIWKATIGLGNAIILKDPGTSVEKGFLDAVAGDGSRRKAAGKLVN